MYTDGCENIWIKIKDFNVIIGTIYIHPKNDLQKFVVGLNTSLEKLKNNKTMYLIGEFYITLDQLMIPIVFLIRHLLLLTCLQALATFQSFPCMAQGVLYR